MLKKGLLFLVQRLPGTQQSMSDLAIKKLLVIFKRKVSIEWQSRKDYCKN